MGGGQIIFLYIQHLFGRNICTIDSLTNIITLDYYIIECWTNITRISAVARTQGLASLASHLMHTKGSHHNKCLSLCVSGDKHHVCRGTNKLYIDRLYCIVFVIFNNLNYYAFVTVKISYSLLQNQQLLEKHSRMSICLSVCLSLRQCPFVGPFVHLSSKQ